MELAARWRWKLRRWHPRRLVRSYLGRDSLTRLGTSQQGRRLLRRDLARGRGGAVILCDIDHMLPFNHANDHVLGDELLRLIAEF